MHYKNLMFQNGLAFTLVCLCLSINEEWLNYSAFSKLPTACMSKSCYAPATNETGSTNICDCDETCKTYDTCCYDSPYTVLKQSTLGDKRMQCTLVPETAYSAYIITNCHPYWNGHEEIRSTCESRALSKRDPFTMIPVTNTFSNATYKNYFCAICNFEDQNIVLWHFVVTFFNEDAKYANEYGHEAILRRLEYNENSYSWGIWRDGRGKGDEFMAATLTIQLPSSTVKTLVKMCNQGIISKCADTWADEILRRICLSYMSPLVLPINDGQGITYEEFRNPHCALCNGITNFKEASCFAATAFGAEFPTLSFTLLLDVNPSGGHKVGETSTCAENEVYDPFFKKCRNLVCVFPGQIVKNGKCENA